MKKLPFLWEIGCEEIPASWLSRTIRELEERAKKELAEAGLDAGSVASSGTMRRLVLHVPKLAHKQPTAASK